MENATHFRYSFRSPSRCFSLSPHMCVHKAAVLQDPLRPLPSLRAGMPTVSLALRITTLTVLLTIYNIKCASKNKDNKDNNKRKVPAIVPR